MGRTGSGPASGPTSPMHKLALDEKAEPFRSFMFSERMHSNAMRLTNRKRLKAQSDIRKLATLGRFLVAHEGPVPEGAAADQQEGKGAVFDPALATLDAETSYSMDTNEK